MPPLPPPTLVTIEPLTASDIDVLKNKFEDVKRDSTALTDAISTTQEQIADVKESATGALTDANQLVDTVRTEFQDIEKLLSTTTSVSEIASKLPPETVAQVRAKVYELANKNLITEKIFRKQYPRLYNLLIK